MQKGYLHLKKVELKAACVDEEGVNVTSRLVGNSRIGGIDPEMPILQRHVRVNQNPHQRRIVSFGLHGEDLCTQGKGNGLHPVGREDVRNLVPTFVFENCEQYQRCDLCGKIYWLGSHVQNALKFLEKNNIKIIKNEEM